MINMEDFPSDWIYFLRPVGFAGPIKIGTSTNPLSRIKVHQPSSPFELELVALVPGGPRYERWLHKQMAPWRRHHEWFDINPGLQAYLDAAVKLARPLALGETLNGAS